MEILLSEKDWDVGWKYILLWGQGPGGGPSRSGEAQPPDGRHNPANFSAYPANEGPGERIISVNEHLG
jgi:hypothetical protein